MGVLKEIVESTPVVGQAIGFGRTAQRVYNSTTPVGAVASAVEGLFVDCLPPNIKYPIKCGVFVIQCGVAVASAANPITGPMSIGLAIGQATSILSEKIV